LLQQWVEKGDPDAQCKIESWFTLHAEEFARSCRLTLDEDGVMWVANRVVEPAMRGLRELWKKHGKEADPEIYLRQKIRGKASDYLRRSPSTSPLPPDTSSSQAGNDVFEQPQTRQAIYDCLRQHGGELVARAVYLRYADQRAPGVPFTWKEIARLFCMSPAALRQRVSRALRQEDLKKCIAQNAGISV